MARTEPDLLQLLWEAGHALQAMSRKMERTLGVSGPQRLVLREIARQPGILPGELAGELGIHPSTVTGLVERLVKQGHVTRAKDPEDGRAVLLSPTEQGRSLLARDDVTIESVVKETTSRVPPEQRRAAASFLREVAVALRTTAETL